MKRNYLPLGALALSAALLGSTAQAALIEAELPAATGAASAPDDAEAAWLAATAAGEGRAFALAAAPMAGQGTLQSTAAAIGSRSLPTPGTMSLWTFITSMRAQQQGDRFMVLETHVSLLRLAESPPAPVPLPGALWLMVMGLLGFAGVRATGQGAPGKPPLAAGDRQPLPAF